VTISIITPFAGDTASLLPDYDRATVGAELIIIDNACSPETHAALQTLPSDRGFLIQNDTNMGFAAANNQGYAHASGDIIIFLNSDVAGDPSWLALVASDVKDGALYGPSLQSQLVAGRHLPYLEGWCVAATRKTWERILTWPEGCALTGVAIGPWDAEAYPGPYWEDNDLCYRALRAGLSLVQTAWPIQHKGGRTAGAIQKHAKSFEQNRDTFTRRVQAEETRAVQTPTYAQYQAHCVSSSDIQHHLPLLFSLARGNVVELGTRSGVSTSALLAGVEAHGGRVWSVDIDARSAQVAAGHPLWTFIQGDSRAPELPAQVGTVNLLLIDTEHTYQQAKAELALWHRAIAPGGFVVMHDPETFPGVRRAAQEFAQAHNWPLTFVLPNNGMAVLERPNDA
jgi:cephalosporin hydroxylase